MGQRLVVTILDDNGNRLANAYFHWSGFTYEALEVTNRCVQVRRDLVKNEDDLHYAVRILLAAYPDAGIYGNKSLEALKKLYPDESYRQSTDRNAGLITVDEQGMNESQDWSEGDVVIHIDETGVSRIIFDAFLWEPHDNFLDEYEDVDYLPYYGGEMNPKLERYLDDGILLNEWPEFYDMMYEHKDKTYWLWKDLGYMAIWIQ